MTKTPFLLVLVLLLALVPAACSRSDDDMASSGAADTSAADGGGQSEDPSSGGGDGDAVPASAPELPGVAPKVIQTASLSLSVEKGDYEEAVSEARSVAARLGGFVVSSETNRARANQ